MTLNKGTSLHWRIKNKNKIITTDEKILNNFKRNNLDYGFVHEANDELSDAEKKDLINESINIVGKEFFYNSFTKNNIGNSSNYIKMNKRYIIFSEFNFINWLYILNKNIDLNKVKYICEIGSGYGGLVEKFYLHFNHFKFLIIDLKHSVYVTEYYLKNNFPHLKIKSINDSSYTVNKDLFLKFDIVICNNDINIDNIPIDMFINARSFAEMEYSQINNYFNFINKNIVNYGYFININRYTKRSVGYDIDLCKYPYDDKWSVLYSGIAWKQEHIHFLITKRTKTKSGNIKNTLKALRNKTLILKLKLILNIKPSKFKNLISLIYYSSLNFLNFLIYAILPYKVYIFVSLKIFNFLKLINPDKKE